MKTNDIAQYPVNGAVRRFFLVIKLLAIVLIIAGGAVKG